MGTRDDHGKHHSSSKSISAGGSRRDLLDYPFGRYVYPRLSRILREGVRVYDHVQKEFLTLGRFSRMSLKSMSEAFDLRLMDVIEFSCGCVSVPLC